MTSRLIPYEEVVQRTYTIHQQRHEKAVRELHGGKAPGEDHISADLLKDGGKIVLGKLANLYTQSLLTASAPEWKNANIITIHEKVIWT